MRSIRFLFVSLLTIVAFTVGAISPATAGSARPAADTKCKHVSAVATGTGQVFRDGSIVTTATVTKDPLLKGKLDGQFVFTGEASFAGSIIFTTKKGTLTVDAAGTLSNGGANFQTSGPVTAGTGDFAGSTGDLVIEGTQNLETGAFTETIEGGICLITSP